MTGRYLNLYPFKSTLQECEHIQTIGAYNYYSNLIGNILLFIPLPIILLTTFKLKKITSILLIGFITSLSIEILQYIFEVGVADVDDIILNTTGTIIGWLCYNLFLKKIYSVIFTPR